MVSVDLKMVTVSSIRPPAWKHQTCRIPAPAWAAGSLSQDRQTAADEEGALWWICLPARKHEWHSCTAAGQDLCRSVKTERKKQRHAQHGRWRQ